MLDYPSKEAVEKLRAGGTVLTEDLNQNISLFKSMFKNIGTFVVREFSNKNDARFKFCIFYIDGMVNSETINENIIKPLMHSKIQPDSQNLLDMLANQIILINQVQKSGDIQQITESLNFGDTILFVEGEKDALILETKSFTLRSLSEPSAEQILSGPREGFNESLLVNLSLLRRRIKDKDLKMEYHSFGTRTHTRACICYVEGIADPNILEELHKRLQNVNIDGIIDTNYLREIIKDKIFTPFRTVGVSERPDVVAAKLLEGRIAILIEGSPVAITLPYLFVESFQSNEDYYLNFIYASFERFIRILSFFLTIITPGLYICAVGYHHDLIPFELFLSFTAQRSSVPLPASIEAFLLLIVFEIIKEAGIRMPSNMGQALSIVGALVIGQAAVEARLVAASMIIVVSLTAITNLLIPKLRTPAILFRYFLLLISSVMGYFGFIVGLSLILVHLLSLRSFGIPYLTPIDRFSLKPQDFKDVLFRVPWCKMKQRPAMAVDKMRQKEQGGGKN